MKARNFFVVAVVLLAGTSMALAEPKTESKPETSTYQDQVRQMLPVAYWSFQGTAPDLGEVEGKIEFGQPGPTSKEFKSFRDDNRAARFGYKDSFIRLEDIGPGSQFDFDNGDPITIEAWVNPDKEVPARANMYILGKGRTGNPGFAANNQNYGLRLLESGGFLKLSWLFRSRAEGDQAADWRRWDSSAGIKPGTGWHHVAITYVFGDPNSVRGYVDGESVEGAWNGSYGGPSKLPPVIDDDEIWVGTSGGQSASVTFHGLLDEVALYRRALTEEQLAERYPIEEYIPKVDLTTLPAGKVRVEIVENLGRLGKWPRRFNEPTDIYEEDAFGFFQIAQKYNEAGIRTDRSNPYLLRAMAKVTLTEGEQKILMRTRGKGRLWIDGEVVAETAFGPTGGGAHNVVTEHAMVEAPNLRYLGPGDRETLVTVQGDGKEHAVVLEMIAGNGRVRATLGETSLSLANAAGEFELLAPGDREVTLSDSGWEAYRLERMSYLRDLNRERRAELQTDEDQYWNGRHEKARKAVAAAEAPAHADVDAFLGAAWAKSNAAAAQAKGGIDFGEKIKPILAENCYRCHEEKTKGGLRLSDRDEALKGGDSELPAIVPGKPAESFLVEMIHPDAGDDIMPPKGDPLTEGDRKLIEQWISEGASYTSAGKKVVPTELTGDLEFLRRVTLDSVGVVPSAEEIAAFQKDDPAKRRENAIGRLLADRRWADHWVSYWQDVLAENPNILKPSLNNSGPFRFFIHEALSDNKAMDRFVTELIMMEGSALNGGPAGFGLAHQNDVPMAAKAHILGTAFLGVEMKCARCHDAPYHDSKQRDLFQMAAMLKRQPIKLPATSSVAMTTFEGRKPLIEMTLKPGDTVEAKWPAPFAEQFAAKIDESVLKNPEDSRERLAALITSPENERFSQVIVNRVWKRLIGHGFVDPVDDWEASKPLYPELLDWLSRELVTNGYDLKHVVGLILNSDAYQRKARPLDPGVTPDFSAPLQRRLTAEQVVDSLFSAVGKNLDSEEMTMDNDGTQVAKTMISLGYPTRAWEFASLSNERDRPSLAIPKAQSILDVLENFGWRSSRQEPKSVREVAANVRQPAIVANGTVGRWVTTLSDDSDLTALAMEDLTQDALVEQVFLRLLTRKPTAEEKVLYAELLSEGFAGRVIPEDKRPPAIKRDPLGHVSWSNHLSPEANRIKIELEKRAREGDPPTVALQPEWRERMEDMLWAMLNSPEFVFVP